MTNLRARIDAEYGGILPHHGIFYLLGIANASHKCVQHYKSFLNLDMPDPSPESALYEFYSAVIHAGNVSAFFWPNPKVKTAVARSATLRSAFCKEHVDRIKDRELRNRISHLDERIDTFCAQDSIGEMVEGFIGDVNLVRGGHQHVLRMVDPKAEIAILHGYEFSYSGFFESVLAIGLEAQKKMASGGNLYRHG